jgi:hypothetical protein
VIADELTPEQQEEVAAALQLCRAYVYIYCVACMPCRRVREVICGVCLQFDLWDFAPSLDEEEEALESGGFRSMIAMRAALASADDEK